MWQAGFHCGSEMSQMGNGRGSTPIDPFRRERHAVRQRSLSVRQAKTEKHGVRSRAPVDFAQTNFQRNILLPKTRGRRSSPRYWFPLSLLAKIVGGFRFEQISVASRVRADSRCGALRTSHASADGAIIVVADTLCVPFVSHFLVGNDLRLPHLLKLRKRLLKSGKKRGTAPRGWLVGFAWHHKWIRNTPFPPTRKLAAGGSRTGDALTLGTPPICPRKTQRLLGGAVDARISKPSGRISLETTVALPSMRSTNPRVATLPISCNGSRMVVNGGCSISAICTS